MVKKVRYANEALEKFFLLLTAFVTLCGAGCAQLNPLLEKAEGLLGGVFGSSEENIDSSNVNNPDEDPDETPDEDPDETPDEDPDETPDEDPDETPDDEYETITVSEALALCGEEGNITTERYYIRATVDKITNGIYGEMTISDETGSIYVYGTYSKDGSKTFEQLESKPQKGDEVFGKRLPKGEAFFYEIALQGLTIVE